MYYSDDHDVDNSGSERYSTKDDLSKSFEVVLKDLPEVLHYIKRLNEHIRKQQTTIIKLFEKLKEFKTKSFNTAVASTQTDEDPYYNYWNGATYDPSQTYNTSQTYDTAQAAAWGATAAVTNSHSVETATTENVASAFAEEIKQAAESAMQQTGFVYEASSGLYYDYNTGYYYNAELGLYYDGTTGTYFYYNEGTNQFEYHSQASFPEEEEEAKESGGAKAPPPLPTGCPPEINVRAHSIPSLKPPPPPLPPKSPPPTAKSSDRKRSSKEEPTERKRRREASPVEGRQSPEDGEITDSGSSNDAAETVEKLEPSILHKEENDEEMSDKDMDSPPPTPPGETSSRFPNNPISELVNAWPPCIRVIVQKTALTNLKVGALFIVTCDGGTLGREEGHAVCIPDINISKHHARFTFDSDDGKYYITDLGSRNGTLLDGSRLSSAKQESEPHLIEHDCKLQLGSTVLLCHIHGGNETCSECEPGVVGALNQSSDIGSESVVPVPLETKGSQHKQELRRLRKKFGLTTAEAAAEAAGASCPAAGYEDRAHNRRQTVGSTDHNVKTEVASVEEHIKPTNKGFKMLSKMGWVHGQGLGKEGSGGISEPIAVGQRPEKAGLGVDLDTIPPEVDDRTKRKTDVWKKTQQRYSELPADKTSTDDED